MSVELREELPLHLDEIRFNIARITLAIALLPTSRAIGQEITFPVQGLEYLRLPPQFCRGTSGSLVGKLKNDQYSSLICQRKSRTYIFLQKLIGYSDTEEAIWKIQNVTQLPKLDKTEFVLQLGCRHVELKKATIFAIVKQIDPGNLSVTRAWRVSLIREKLEEVNPQKVVCTTPSLL